MDDSCLIQAPDDQGDARVDLWLRVWFQQMLAEPIPSQFHDLIERLDGAGGL